MGASIVLSRMKGNLMGEKQIKTDCYKCQREIDSYADVVHPLCDDCDVEYNEWFYKQLEELEQAR